MSDLIDRQAALDAIKKLEKPAPTAQHLSAIFDCEDTIKALPSAQPGCEDAVPWEQLERYAEWFCAQVSYPEFVREAKAFCKSTIAAMKGGNIAPSVTPKQPGWIPCDRELPKPNEEDGNGFYKAYLVQDGRWMDVARWDGKYWVAWGYSTVLLNVVAWCELPTPWERGQDE